MGRCGLINCVTFTFTCAHVQEAKQKKARAKRERQRMQLYTGDFFKEPSPDSDPFAEDEVAFGFQDDYPPFPDARSGFADSSNSSTFGASQKSESTVGFGVPVKRQAVHLAESDYWDIPPVKCVAIFIIVANSAKLVCVTECSKNVCGIYYGNFIWPLCILFYLLCNHTRSTEVIKKNSRNSTVQPHTYIKLPSRHK